MFFLFEIKGPATAFQIDVVKLKTLKSTAVITNANCWVQVISSFINRGSKNINDRNLC